MKKDNLKEYEIFFISETHNSLASLNKAFNIIVEKAKQRAAEDGIELSNHTKLGNVEFLYTTFLKYEISSVKRASYYFIRLHVDSSFISRLILEMQTHKIILRFICLDYKDNIDIIEKLDYKYPEKSVLKYTSELGHILPASKNGLSKKDNKKVATAIKIARIMALHGFVNY